MKAVPTSWKYEPMSDEILKECDKKAEAFWLPSQRSGDLGRFGMLYSVVRTWLPTFRESISVPTSKVKQTKPSCRGLNLIVSNFFLEYCLWRTWSPLLLGEVPDCEGACCVTRGLTPPSRSIVTTPNTEKTHSPLIQLRKRRLEQE
jgi:hypothetical protein